MQEPSSFSLSDGQNPILIQTYVLMNMGTVLGLKVDFIIGTADYMNIRIDKITEVVSLRGDKNIIFLNGIWIKSSLRLNDDGSCIRYQWYTRIKCSDGQNPILIQTYVLMNMGTVIGTKIEFIIVTLNWMNLELDKIKELGSLIGGYNSLFFSGRLIQSSLRLKNYASWFRYQWYLRVKFSDIQNPILRHYCVLMDMGPVIGIKVDFILVNAD